MKRIDRTGMTYGNFTIKKQKIDNKVNYSLCLCNLCGNMKWIRTDYVVGEKIKSCGCEKNKILKNSIGKEFGALTILRPSPQNKRKVICKCRLCKEEKEMDLYHVVYQKPKSCGCEKNISDISGRRFGFLEPLEPTEKREYGSVIWRCLCHNCGKECFISHAAITQRESTHCGCLLSETRKNIAQKNYKTSLGWANVNDTNVFNLASKKVRNKTGVKGVRITESGKYNVRITFQKKTYHLGNYNTIEEAEKIREIAEEKMFGNFLEWFAEEFPEQWKKLNQ